MKLMSNRIDLDSVTISGSGVVRGGLRSPVASIVSVCNQTMLDRENQLTSMTVRFSFWGENLFYYFNNSVQVEEGFK